MGHARDFPAGATPVHDAEVNLAFQSDNYAVRTALEAIKNHKEIRALSDDVQHTLETVLAEVFNNIVEHAYRDSPGMIKVDLKPKDHALFVRIQDNGHPMPNGLMPVGAAYDLTEMADDLPEGGFGWFLIRELTEDLTYKRCPNKNMLSFSIALNSSR